MIVPRGQPLREILAIVILIIPLITRRQELSDLLRGNKGATLRVTPNIPVTEGQLHKVVVMTLVTIAVVEFGPTTAKNYLDIANLDKYDCILGMPFLRKHGISLDFHFQDIVICGNLHIPTLPEGEGTSAMNQFDMENDCMVKNSRLRNPRPM